MTGTPSGPPAGGIQPDPSGDVEGPDELVVDEPLVAALAETVAQHPVRRVPLGTLRAAHARHDPTGASSGDARTRLAVAVAVLTARGMIQTPRSRGLWESHVAPRLPSWVERPAAPRPVRAPVPVRVWRPELAAAAAVAASADDFDVLTRVDAFLRDGGAARPLVPHRERSVALFGNEKRLDRLRRRKLFTSGALTLELLRCYVAPLPLTAQHTGDPGPAPQLLIVENHATYASVLTVARERAHAGSPAIAVGYGSGNQLPSAIAGAAQLDPVPVALWYFGDLDEEGLRIARDADREAREAGLPPLRAALPLYARLLTDGHRQPGNKPMPAADAADLAGWLGDDTLTAQAVAVLTAGQRIAQESVGYEQLVGIDPWW